MIPLFGKAAEECNLKGLLNEVEKFKSWRNALAHGLDRTNPEEPHKLIVEVVSRSGKEKQVEITPESHIKMIEDVANLAHAFAEARKYVCDY